MAPHVSPIATLTAAAFCLAAVCTGAPLQYGSQITARMGDGTFKASTSVNFNAIILEEWR